MAEPMVEEADLEHAEGGEREIGTSRTSKAAVEVKGRCPYCGDAMVRGKRPHFNRAFGISLLVVGVLISLFMLFVGLPLVVIVAYMGIAARPVWVCAGCAAVVDRDDN